MTVCTLRPPQYFGELGLLLNTGHTASVVTVAPTEIYMLSKFDWKRQVPGATRGAMVSAMLSHAKAAYEFSNVVRSISIGLSDESFTLPDNLSHFLAEEEKKQEAAAAAQQQQQQQHGALGGGGGGGVPSAVRIVSEPPRGGGGGGGGGGSHSVGPAEVAATPRTREQERKDAEEEAGRLRRELLLPLFTPSIIQATAVGLLIPVLPLRALHLSAGLDSVVGVVVSGAAPVSSSGAPSRASASPPSACGAASSSASASRPSRPPAAPSARTCGRSSRRASSRGSASPSSKLAGRCTSRSASPRRTAAPSPPSSPGRRASVPPLALRRAA